MDVGTGRTTYQVCFAGRPELSLDPFETERSYAVGDVLEGFREGIDEPTLAWAVSAVVPGREGRPDTLVFDLIPRQVITISDAALGYAKDHGGRVYVWENGLGGGAGFLRASTANPDLEEAFERHEVSEVDVFVAESVTPPEIKVRLDVTRRKLVAEWPKGGVPGGGAGPL